MHLTLAFLGETHASHADRLIYAASQWEIPAQPWVLDYFGLFERARVVWAGPSGAEDRAWLQMLHDTLWHRLADLGWEPSEQTFKPHVSLLRNARPADLSGLQRPPVVCTPAFCAVVASQPAANKSRYQVLAQLRLVHNTIGSDAATQPRAQNKNNGKR